jgi:hypothetical protein
MRAMSLDRAGRDRAADSKPDATAVDQDLTTRSLSTWLRRQNGKQKACTCRRSLSVRTSDLLLPSRQYVDVGIDAGPVAPWAGQAGNAQKRLSPGSASKDRRRHPEGCCLAVPVDNTWKASSRSLSVRTSGGFSAAKRPLHRLRLAWGGRSYSMRWASRARSKPPFSAIEATPRLLSILGRMAPIA